MLTTHSFFTERLPVFLADAGNPPPAVGSFLFDIQGEGGGRWTLDLRGAIPRCHAGAEEATDCTISLENEDLGAVLRREENLEELYYRQRVKVSGDLRVAAGLLKLFSEVTAPEAQHGLAELLAPHSPSDFIERYWPGQPLLIAPNAARVEALQAMAPLTSLETLLAKWPALVRVFPPGDSDELSPHVTADAAEALYERGFTLVFDSVDRHFPDLARWLETVRTELALPPNVWGRCMVYATPAGSGFNPHFDENANFAMQILGAKRWRIAPNESISEPTVGHRLGGDLSPELVATAHAPLPSAMPEDSRQLTLEAGAALFLPRAWWHHTTAVENSLSLNFTFDQPCWADVLTTALRTALIRSPKWRELATGVGSRDPARAAAAQKHAAEMLAGLAREIKDLDCTTLLSELQPSRRGGELIDLRRNWVAALAHLGRRPAKKSDASVATSNGTEPPVGMLLYERLLAGFDNPSGITGVCQFEIEGPGGGTFHLLVDEHALRYVEGPAEKPTAWVRMSTQIARDLAVGTNVDFRDQLNFEAIDVEGDNTLLGMLAQMTKLPNRDAGERFAQAEQRATRLPRAREPLRLERPTAAQVSEAVEKSIPLIVTGGLPGWEEALGWSFERLRERFGDVPIRSTLGLTSMARFLDELAATQADGTPPYTIGSTMPDVLRPFFPPPFFDPASFGQMQLWMGSGPGRISTLLHRDSGDAFLGQVIGRKQFKLYSPDQTPYMYVYRSYNRDQPCWANPWEPDYERFPLFRNAEAMDFTLQPSELLVIPRGWYHTVLALDATLSVGIHRQPVSDFGRTLGQDEATSTAPN